MLDLKSAILMLSLTSCGVVTAFVVGMLVYRGTLALREHDQIFLGAMGWSYVREHRMIVSRILRVQGLAVALLTASAMLWAVTVSVWMYQGYSSF